MAMRRRRRRRRRRMRLSASSIQLPQSQRALLTAEANLQLLSGGYLQSNQAYAAYHILKGSKWCSWSLPSGVYIQGLLKKLLYFLVKLLFFPYKHSI
nr:uncharacterized protein LOC114821626 isoform X2 [Malus domestica]